jgi:hypothetical protein
MPVEVIIVQGNCSLLTSGLRINPLVTIATFLGRTYLNLQGMWSMVKTEFHFFVVFFKLKITKIFVYEYFHVFLTVHVNSTAYYDKTLTVHRK